MLKKDLIKVIERFENMVMNLDREKDSYELSVIYNSLACLYTVLDLECVNPDRIE